MPTGKWIGRKDRRSCCSVLRMRDAGSHRRMQLSSRGQRQGARGTRSCYTACRRGANWSVPRAGEHARSGLMPLLRGRWEGSRALIWQQFGRPIDILMSIPVL